MNIERILSWLDRTLDVASFDDVSNNGLQLASSAGEVVRVAFAVDASVAAVKAAAESGARLLVVHHGISWGGGIRRIDGGVYGVVKAAMDADLAIYASHLPLDAHPALGNNARIAAVLRLRRVKRAFTYHGNVIGLVGVASPDTAAALQGVFGVDLPAPFGSLVGVCSGGAGEFAEEAKKLGCSLFVTGEASWGDVIAAQNCGMRMACCGHYATEVFGVRALSAAMKRALKIDVVDLTETLA